MPTAREEFERQYPNAMPIFRSLESSRERYRRALEALATWPLPRWDPDDPQTEGEQMRLYAMETLDGTS